LKSNGGDFAMLEVEPTSIEPIPGRIVSVDVLRGFDMFWIVGGKGFFVALFSLFGLGISKPLVRQLHHSHWVGFRFYDLIFPLFVFVVGMSVVFSLEKILAQKGKKAAYKRVFRRFLILYLLGIFYYHGIQNGFENIRLLGVLQRLAITYLFAAIFFIHLNRKAMLGVLVAILIGYWAWLSFVPVPGLHEVSFAEGKNWANWIDAHYLPLRKWNGVWDPEGLLSTIPAIASALLGVFAALIIRSKYIEPKRKVAIFVGGGAVLVVAGLLWGLQFPIIKKIWTSSYVLLAGGYSAILLGVFYLIVDVWKMQKWAIPFVWIGMNPITIYMARNMVQFDDLAKRLVGGQLSTAFGASV
jgi:predicted acyltransferase